MNFTSFSDRLPATRGDLKALKSFIEQETGKIMSQATDLNAVVVRIENANSAELKAISDKLATIPNPDPAVTEAISRLTAVAVAMENEAATLEPPVTPPATV